MIATKQIAYRCIWCLREPPDATFGSESHVLPACVGNKRQQVLSPGIVCDQCNRSFGRKVENTLIKDPIFSTQVGILQLRDKEGDFAYERSPSGVHRDVHVDIEVSDNKVTVNTKYEIRGQPHKAYESRAIPPKSKDYDSRSLALLSRAFHKIAFESLAHSLFVGEGLNFVNVDLNNIDIFDRSFETIRKWARYGEPYDLVRPVLRLQKEVKTQKELLEWGGRLSYFQQWFRYELNLFGDWYIMSITSPSDKVDNDLRCWLERTKFSHPVWMVGDKLYQLYP